MIELNKEINLVIKNMKKTEDELILLIGMEKWNEYEVEGTFYPDFIGTGYRVLRKVSKRLQQKICIVDSGVPEQWIQELIDGDIRELILAIITTVTAKFEGNIAIAIPLTALVLKKGLREFCESSFEE